MNKVINITVIQNGKQALLCLSRIFHFVYAYISYILVLVSPYIYDEYILLIAADIDN